MEGDWTPTKTKLSQLTTYRGGSLISFQDKIVEIIRGNLTPRLMREQLSVYMGELGICKRVDVLSHLEVSKAVEYLRQAMRELVDQAAEHDNISTIYVVDQDEVLVGAIDLKDLIIAREGTELDANNRLKGVLTAQDITRLVDDEMGDDYAKLAGLTAEEDLQEPLKKSLGKRLPWLIILLGLGMVVSTVVGLFEEVVAQLALIVCFQSLVLDMAGNVGTQSLAVTIRVLMDEQISTRQKLYLIGKEARVGLLNGAILGTLVDPAVASGPLITTVNDLVAVVTYYGLAWLMLIQVFHL